MDLHLNELSNPECFTEPINIKGADAKRLIEQLRMMWIIRKAEEKIADKVISGQIKCPCHLGIGQEAIAVGVAEMLKKSDRVFGAHRSHSHFLSQGGSVHSLFAEILGKLTGCSKGMGGSMHLFDKSNGFYGSVPIVAGTVSLAVGAALAAKKDGGRDIAVAYFGDGAAEEGTVQESMNFAATFHLPVLFVCENNMFSSHLHIDLRQPARAVARYAEAHRIPYEIVDGNDVIAVQKATERLLHRARAGEGPGFLEAVTYRWRGHVGPSEDIDVGVKRSIDLTKWKRRDPVDRLAQSLIADGSLTSESYQKLQGEVQAEIEAAWNQADRDPYPPLAATLDLVYKQGAL